MAKYLKQPDLSGCGPIAIINVGKVYGKKWTLKKYKLLRKKCKTTKEGTDPSKVCKVLKALKFKVKYKTKASWVEIEKSLNAGDPVILGYNKIGKEVEGHFVVLKSIKGTKVEVLNYIADKDFNKIDKDHRHLFKTLSLVPISKIKQLIKTENYFQEKVLPDLIFIEKI